MTFNLFKTLTVLFVCLTFIGQTMTATAMPYQMMSIMEINVQETSKNMSMMEHCKHNQMSSSSENIEADSSESSTESCCNQVCNCFTGGCTSTATLTKSPVINSAFFYLSSKIYSISNLALSQQPTSLYRPPILS